MDYYEAITRKLMNNKELSLGLYYTSMSSGIKNFRTAALFEPDPYEGEVANPESGLDQQFLHGSRRVKPYFHFKGKHIIEALNLLDRTCNSEKDLEDTVQEGWPSRNIPYVHGLNSPESSLDNWVFHGFRFKIQQKEDKDLFLDVTSNEFYSNGFSVSSKKIKDVGEGIALYQQNGVTYSELRNLQNGILLGAGISKYAGLKIKEEDLPELAKGTIREEFLERYQTALEILKPFDITNESKKGLFISMLLEIFHEKKK